VHVAPLGQYFAPIAFRKTLSGLPEVPWPAFWAVDKQ
jgi:hypothetical protein